MKAIETEYNGYLFRSRLEARWGVFLDKLGIEWLYEDEGFELSDGTWYLPDFYLPTFDCGTFVEVKPKELTDIERKKCMLLCEESHKTVWLAVGVPDFKCYEVFYYHRDGFVLEGDGIPNADQAEFENRFFAMSAYGDAGGMINMEYRTEIGDTLPFAIKEAKHARFEHKTKH